MAEEHTHKTVNEDEEHSYTHEHDDGHVPHGHNESDSGDNEEIVEIWEEDPA